MNLQDKIAAIKSDCEERLPDLPRFGGEARARRAVLAAIVRANECAMLPTNQDCPAGNHGQAVLGLDILQAIADAWDGRAE